ncbi:hypothetical protein [Nocardia sp. NPDC051570]|uniref:hypothetical protein n=1 Tax=Nocardia sp. NPDC051570 TaxID=3364324 RepID=UPI0037BCA6B6
MTLVADQLRKAHHPDVSAKPVNVDLDAELIGASVGGLAQGTLAGYCSAAGAVELLDHLLDRVLGPYSGN